MSVDPANGPVDWDARTYDRVAAPQEEWGREVLARLELAGDETVLDAGCGSGRVTRLLCERLPEGRVIGVDGSPSMIEHARENLAEFGDRVELIVSDLLALELPDPVDAIFSNATFHWILDHERLFQRLFAALRPGGVLEAQCGGKGNVAEWKRALEALQGDERFSAYLSRDARRPRTSPRSATPATGSSGPASRCSPPASGSSGGRSSRPIRGRSPAPSASPSTSCACPPSCTTSSPTRSSSSMPRPLVLEYVRLNISARRPG